MKIAVRYILVLFVAFIVTSCGEASLQKYFVEKQDDPKFMKIDLAPSLLEGKNTLGAEEKETLKGIKKINVVALPIKEANEDRKSTRLNSSHVRISYAVFCLKKKKKKKKKPIQKHK